MQLTDAIFQSAAVSTGFGTHMPACLNGRERIVRSLGGRLVGNEPPRRAGRNMLRNAHLTSRKTAAKYCPPLDASVATPTSRTFVVL